MLWMTLAGCFAVLIYFFGHVMTGRYTRPNSELSLEFVTGYLIEESLSVDNLFVFLVIFRYFAGAAKVSARGAVLGSRGRAGDARCIHSGRHQAAERFLVADLRVRRDPHLQRH